MSPQDLRVTFIKRQTEGGQAEYAIHVDEDLRVALMDDNNWREIVIEGETVYAIDGRMDGRCPPRPMPQPFPPFAGLIMVGRDGRCGTPGE